MLSGAALAAVASMTGHARPRGRSGRDQVRRHHEEGRRRVPPSHAPVQGHDAPTCCGCSRRAARPSRSATTTTTASTTSSSPIRPRATTSHLYHNNGNLTFTDVTEKAGVGGGNDPLSIVADALWFDYDNDGWRDLLVARFGTPLLYHNENNGTFKDVSARVRPQQVRQHDRRDRLRLRQRRPPRPDVRQLLQAGEPARPEDDDPHVLPNDLDNAVNGGGVTLWHGDGERTLRGRHREGGLRQAHRLDARHRPRRLQQRRPAGRLPGLRLRHRPASSSTTATARSAT